MANYVKNQHKFAVALSQLCPSPSLPSLDLDQRMSAVITKVSSMLDITAPPIYGGVVLRKGSKLTAAASSPALKRQSLIESFSPFSSSKDEKKQKR